MELLDFVDTLYLGKGEGSIMPKSHVLHPLEFRQQMVELVRVGRSS